MTLFLGKRPQTCQLPGAGWSPAGGAELTRPWLCSLAPPGPRSPDALPSLGLSLLASAQARPCSAPTPAGKPSSRATCSTHRSFPF